MSLGPGEAFDHIYYSDLGTTSHSHSSVVREIKKRTNGLAVRCLLKGKTFGPLDTP